MYSKCLEVSKITVKISYNISNNQKSFIMCMRKKRKDIDQILYYNKILILYDTIIDKI